MKTTITPPYQEKHEGIIVKVDKTEQESNPFSGKYLMLVIRDVENINFLGKTEDELVKLAQENDGAYYVVSLDMYEELNLDIGT
jgi:hypothetical protein